jgi:hypothetical protein
MPLQAEWLFSDILLFYFFFPPTQLISHTGLTDLGIFFTSSTKPTSRTPVLNERVDSISTALDLLWVLRLLFHFFHHDVPVWCHPIGFRLHSKCRSLLNVLANVLYLRRWNEILLKSLELGSTGSGVRLTARV